jgi:ATP-dependent protease ClpP protease subunit
MKSWFKMLVKNAIAEIEIYDEIGMWGIGFKTFKAMLDDLGDIKSINLRINSPGGDVIDGFAIYNVLKEHKAKINVIIDGYAASIASIVAMAGDTISMPENTFMFIHNPWMYIMGDSESLRKHADLLDKMKANAITAYRSKAKDLSDEDISLLMNNETWLTADEAKEKGFSDKTIKALEIKNCFNGGKLKIPDKIKNMQMSTFKLPEGGKGETKMFKCPKCGKEHSTEMKFCGDCGAVMKMDISAAHAKEVKEAQEHARAEERSRVAEITARCRKFNLSSEFEGELISEGVVLHEAITKILDKIQEVQNTETDPTKVAGGEKVLKDEADKFRSAAKNSILVYAGIEKDEKIRASVHGSDAPSGIQHLIRACLIREGKMSINKISTLASDLLAREGIRMARMDANISSSDLPAILENVINKSAASGMAEEPTTWQAWCASGDANDFKNISMVSKSAFGDMKEIKEGEPFTKGRISDKKETASLKTYGRAATLTRNAIINDDMSAFTDLPRDMTMAQYRAINQGVYDALTSNSLVGPTMTEDGYALFDASNHVNLIDPSNVPSITTLDKATLILGSILRLKPEKSAKSVPTGAIPKYLITGIKNRATVDSIIKTSSIIQVSGTTTYNGYTGLQAIYDAYLGSLLTTASKEYAWYLAADQNILPTFKVFFLRGNRIPTFQLENSGAAEALGITYATFFDWCVGLQDWRGLVYNDGAST